MNQSTKAFAEAVDLYPTIAELAGLPDPATQGQHLNGTSLVPVFEDPSNASGVKDAAFAQFAKVCVCLGFVRVHVLRGCLFALVLRFMHCNQSVDFPCPRCLVCELFFLGLLGVKHINNTHHALLVLVVLPLPDCQLVSGSACE